MRSRLLTGMWMAEPKFANKSDSDGMLLYIGEKHGTFSNKRTANLIIYKDNEIVHDEIFDFNYVGLELGCNSYLFTIKSEGPLENMRIILNKSQGQMIWKKNGKIYGLFYKRFDL